MTEEASTDARPQLLALIEAAAGRPVPAEQAIPLLKQAETDDVEAFARLAYRALTGVDPGPVGVPAAAPVEVLPGFPAFAGEVLLRAVNGPEERRPTRAALMVVLETTPAGQWPDAEPVVVPAAPSVAPVEQPADEPAEESAEDETPADADEELESASADSRSAEPEETGEHHDFHRVVASSHAVPRFEPLEGAGELPTVSYDVSRTSRSERRRRRRTSATSSEERRQTLIMVAVIAVLIVAGALYAASRDSEEPVESGAPAQGASRVQLQPAPSLL